MNKQQVSRLTNYSALSASFLLLANNSQAQVVYHDVDPDEIVYLEEFYIDMDEDGISDFKFVSVLDPVPGYLPDFVKVRINPLDDNNAANVIQALPVYYSGVPSATYTSGATQIYFTVAPMLNEGETVNAGFNFQSAIANLYIKAFYYVYSSYHFETFKGGYWMDESNHFAALQLTIDGEIHFGWVRLSVDADSGITVHDYAYELQPNTPVETKIVDYATPWISVGDVGTTGTPEDIQFSFTAAADEADLLGYRVVCVKQGAADYFTEEAADLLTPSQYVQIDPDGSASYTNNFNVTSLDSDGDPILPNTGYRLFVQNVMQPVTGFANMLGKASAIVKLIDTVYAVTEVDLLDGGSAGNGSDVVVTFQSAAVIQGIAEYRAMIVKRDAADFFTIEDAASVPAGRYISVPPGTVYNEIYFNESSVDTDGDLIEPGKYKAFVLSVADGSTANVNAIAEPSPSVTIETYTSVASGILIEDIGEFGDGRDMRISFPAPALEQTVEEYRIFITDIIDAFDFNLETALSVSPDNYITVEPTGSDITVNCDPATTDINGTPVTFGIPYYVFVASIASQYGLEDTLSLPSNQLILNFPFTGIENEVFNNGAEIFFYGQTINVNLGNAANGPTKYVVTDASGRRICSSSFEGPQHSFELNAPPGIYYLILKTPRGAICGKISIQ